MICVKEFYNKMKIILIFVIFILSSCSSVRESAGVNRKSIDEFKVIENPPLIIPPDFNLISSNQLDEKKIDNIDNELAQEILFGLDENEKPLKETTSTMNQILLSAEALDVPINIRNEIDEEYMQEIKTNSIFQNSFEDEIEVLDAIKESERLRNKNFSEESFADGDVPIRIEILKKKKKKRFFLF